MNLTTSSLSTRLLRQRLPRVCVPVVGHKPPEMLERAEQVARDNSFIEFRLDYLAHPALFFPKLKDFIEYHPHVTLMATCRRANNGGRYRGSIASEVDILTKAGAAGCHLLDIELESASHLKPHDWQKLKKNAGVILSYHDFRGTKKLEETFRIDRVDAATRVYGVAGDPVSHSLSPLMMNTAFRRENLNAVYLALHAKTMGDLMSCVRDIPIHGMSITMPYKESILKHLDKTEPVTEKIGACNTVIRAQDGKLYGFNTDVAGIIRPLEQRMAISGSKFLVLGSGGAARAAVFGLKERGGQVWIINRTTSTGQKLARQAHAKFIKRAQAAKMQFDAVINATPVGMEGDAGKRHKEPSLLSEKELNARYLFELVYSPAETPLTKLARAKGMHVIPGSEMFVHQGARQFEIWTGKPAPVEEMQRVVLHALEQRALARARVAAVSKKR